MRYKTLLPSPGVEALLEIESYAGNYAKFSGEYVKNDGSKNWINVHHDGFDNLDVVVHELQGPMGESHKWNKAFFKLWPDGTFDMQFHWDQDRDDERATHLKEYEAQKKK